MSPSSMDLATIRRVAIEAIFSDNLLADVLVLKGGNALNLVYKISSRTSVDLDFSMGGDFEDVRGAEQRIFGALKNRFDSIGLVVFDEQFAPKPRLEGDDSKPWWGGYAISFKLIERSRLDGFKNDIEKKRFNSIPVSEGGKRSFKIDLSKWEFTEGKIEADLDGFPVYVYSPEMIAVEKLRAICQQMEKYPHTGNKRARAQDFYDIYGVLTRFEIDFSAPRIGEVVRSIFSAKEVPLGLLGEIDEVRNFHRPDWDSVVASTSEKLESFDFYFDFLVGEIEKLKPLWVE